MDTNGSDTCYMTLLLLFKDTVKGNKMVFSKCLLVFFHVYEALRFMMSPT